jgi:hypothetical protein
MPPASPKKLTQTKFAILKLVFVQVVSFVQYIEANQLFFFIIYPTLGQYKKKLEEDIINLLTIRTLVLPFNIVICWLTTNIKVNGSEAIYSFQSSLGRTVIF